MVSINKKSSEWVNFVPPVEVSCDGVRKLATGSVDARCRRPVGAGPGLGNVNEATPEELEEDIFLELRDEEDDEDCGEAGDAGEDACEACDAGDSVPAPLAPLAPLAPPCPSGRSSRSAAFG